MGIDGTIYRLSVGIGTRQANYNRQLFDATSSQLGNLVRGPQSHRILSIHMQG